MVNVSRALCATTRLEALFLLALCFMSPVVAQAPPTDISTSSRPATQAPNAVAFQHVLDPLRPAEIERAIASVRKNRQLSDRIRFVTISLKEPAKEIVRQARPGTESPREAFLILLDSATARGYEAVVDLRSGSVERYDALPEGVQPPIMLDEFGECEEAAKASPAFREAMKKRGIDDVSLIMVDAWSAGHYGNEPPEDKGKRLVRAALQAPHRAA